MGLLKIIVDRTLSNIVQFTKKWHVHVMHLKIIEIGIIFLIEINVNLLIKKGVLLMCTYIRVCIQSSTCLEGVEDCSKKKNCDVYF